MTGQPPTFPAPIVDFERGDHVDLLGDGVRDAGRYIQEQHWVVVRDDETDAWLNIPLRAVYVDAAGPAVEIGRWSVSPDDARLLADSLRILASRADGKVNE